MKNKLLHNPIFTSKKVLKKISEQIPAISEWEELNLWPSVPKTDILPLYDTLKALRMLVHDTVWTSLHTFLAQLVEHQPSKLVCIGSSPIECAFFWSSKEAWGGIEPPFKDLQSFALPLDDQALEKLVSSQVLDFPWEILSHYVVLSLFMVLVHHEMHVHLKVYMHSKRLFIETEIYRNYE